MKRLSIILMLFCLGCTNGRSPAETGPQKQPMSAEKPASKTEAPALLTFDTYMRIHAGQTYEQVMGVMGRNPNNVIERSPEWQYITAVWQDNDAEIRIFFENGLVAFANASKITFPDGIKINK
jgi:hypothetical protein